MVIGCGKWALVTMLVNYKESLNNCSCMVIGGLLTVGTYVGKLCRILIAFPTGCRPVWSLLGGIKS